eukprot:CAMPEP_0113933786 /NCGR_PEP_ID=MMETSP1339-20121228/1106_1 /TAXON_ID=94617 /ORGANISM="Fibrocapsa japonica" /LENGTH=184 /DNA_ID=CAMNT_0000935253 /DNA_START=20 /DNA_END=575 /DNA_ORIENTATION=- /assembly_acc=CAM_ASM_000762
MAMIGASGGEQIRAMKSPSKDESSFANQICQEEGSESLLEKLVTSVDGNTKMLERLAQFGKNLSEKAKVAIIRKDSKIIVTQSLCGGIIESVEKHTGEMTNGALNSKITERYRECKDEPVSKNNAAQKNTEEHFICRGCSSEICENARMVVNVPLVGKICAEIMTASTQIVQVCTTINHVGMMV